MPKDSHMSERYSLSNQERNATGQLAITMLLSQGRIVAFTATETTGRGASLVQTKHLGTDLRQTVRNSLLTLPIARISPALPHCSSCLHFTF
jgi:hypothetical protein